MAWSHYHVRKTALEQVVTLRPPARALVARVERATVAIPAAARGAALPAAARRRRVRLHHRVAADLGGVPGAPGRGRRVGRPRAVSSARTARVRPVHRGSAGPSPCTVKRTARPRSSARNAMVRARAAAVGVQMTRTPWPRSPARRGAADVVLFSPRARRRPRLAALASNLIGSGSGVTRPERR